MTPGAIGRRPSWHGLAWAWSWRGRLKILTGPPDQQRLGLHGAAAQRRRAWLARRRTRARCCLQRAAEAVGRAERGTAGQWATGRWAAGATGQRSTSGCGVEGEKRAAVDIAAINLWRVAHGFAGLQMRWRGRGAARTLPVAAALGRAGVCWGWPRWAAAGRAAGAMEAEGGSVYQRTADGYKRELSTHRVFTRRGRGRTLLCARRPRGERRRARSARLAGRRGRGRRDERRATSGGPQRSRNAVHTHMWPHAHAGGGGASCSTGLALRCADPPAPAIPDPCGQRPRPHRQPRARRSKRAPRPGVHGRREVAGLGRRWLFYVYFTPAPRRRTHRPARPPACRTLLGSLALRGE